MAAIPAELKTFAAQLPTPLYAVGGFVRDALLGRPSHDIDLCSALTPEQMQACAKAAGIPCPIVNEWLGTVLLCFGDRKYEHTTFRTESYPAGGAHTPSAIAFTDSLEADAFRRDFSINALYQNVLTGQILDPTGGQADLARGILRTTTPDPIDILRDDGLRILRLVRFAVTTGFAIDDATWRCAKANVHLLDDIAWERKRQEFDRLLTEGDVFRALTLLKDCRALFCLIPELSEADGLEQRKDYHRYDVLTHLIHTCAEMPNEAPLRLMGLLHDIGKPACLRKTGNFHRHAVYGEAMARTILRRLTVPNAVIARVCLAVREHMFDLDGKAKVSTVRKKLVALGRQGSEDLIALREGDIRGSGYDTAYKAVRWRKVYEKMQSDGCPWSADELAVSGAELMQALHLAPSHEIAELKNRLLLHCVCHPQDNTKERLLRIARDSVAKVRINC